MKELLHILKKLEPSDGKLIAIALGKYELTGNIIKDTIKVINNGKDNSI